jgi:repressor LexA
MVAFIRHFTDEHGYPPTIREIGKAVNISSTSVVNYNLAKLEEMGLLSRNRDISRGLKLAGEAVKSAARDVVRIPLLGRIAAGEPVPVPSTGFATFTDEDTIELTRELIPDERGLYALQVRGNSMIDALVNDGDIVILRHQGEAKNGEMVAVWLKDREETTLKRFYLENGRVRLQPANPTMGPIYADPNNVEVQGKVILVVRQLN